MTAQKPTYAEIAKSRHLWLTYVDVDGHDSEEAFAATDWTERVALMTEMYGDESDSSMEE